MLLLNDKQTEHEEQVFEGVNLPLEELISKNFYNCTFIKCDFSETVFRECRFYDCKFQNCNLSNMRVTGCSYSNTIFEDSKVIGVDWTAASWPRVRLFCPIQFFKCNISYSTFAGLDLRKTRIKECQAKSVDFSRADLTQADLTTTDFTESLFNETNLTGADLTHARNYAINVLLNNVKRTKFSFPEAMSLLYCLGIKVELD